MCSSFFESTKYNLMWINHFCMRCSVFENDESVNGLEGRQFGGVLRVRLRYFNIFYTDTNVTLDEVKEAVGKELEGPGKLLGYRALHQKIRQEHLLNVP